MNVPDEPITGLDTVKDFQTRFLHLFAFADLQAAVGAFLSAKIDPGGAVWLRDEPRVAYTDEVLEHVSKYLFSDPKAGAEQGQRPGCTYLKLSEVLANKWLRDLRLCDDKTPTEYRLPVMGVPGVRIELFLSPQRVGVLCLTLTPGPGPWPLDAAKRFNYLLAQHKRREAVLLRRRHPKDDPAWETKVRPEHRSQVPPEPAPEAPLLDRLGAPGGSFSLAELIDLLLLPLRERMVAHRAVQEELAVYTVARFGPAMDLDRYNLRDHLAPFLAGLAQVEEPGHADGLAGTVGLANDICNRHHWAAVGQLGCAHLIGDQLPLPDGREPPFNEQRLPIIRDKYFIPYLMALLQRLALHEAIHRACLLEDEPPATAEAKFAVLREDLIYFAVRGHFTQISVREVLHRFYQTTRAGLDVPDAWTEVRRAIADRDARINDQRQKGMAEKQQTLSCAMKRNLAELVRMQKFVHSIESFVVSVYFAHLWHMFAAHNKPLEHWFGENAWSWILSLGVFFWAGIGFAFMSLFNHARKKKEARQAVETGPDDVLPPI